MIGSLSLDDMSVALSAWRPEQSAISHGVNHDTAESSGMRWHYMHNGTMARGSVALRERRGVVIAWQRRRPTCAKNAIEWRDDGGEHSAAVGMRTRCRFECSRPARHHAAPVKRPRRLSLDTNRVAVSSTPFCVASHAGRCWKNGQLGGGQVADGGGAHRRTSARACRRC